MVGRYGKGGELMLPQIHFIPELFRSRPFSSHFWKGFERLHCGVENWWPKFIPEHLSRYFDQCVAVQENKSWLSTCSALTEEAQWVCSAGPEKMAKKNIGQVPILCHVVHILCWWLPHIYFLATYIFCATYTHVLCWCLPHIYFLATYIFCATSYIYCVDVWEKRVGGSGQAGPQLG